MRTLRELQSLQVGKGVVLLPHFACESDVKVQAKRQGCRMRRSHSALPGKHDDFCVFIETMQHFVDDVLGSEQRSSLAI